MAERDVVVEAVGPGEGAVAERAVVLLALICSGRFQLQVNTLNLPAK